MTQAQKLSYRDAGVDIERGDEFVERIKARVQSTYGARVMSGVGGFAALYRMEGGKILAAGTDGVGTKVKIAQGLGQHNTIGIDLVAMCVNDVICTGAKPLFFLDYIATGKLDLAVTEAIIDGVVAGCLTSNMALIGGETAEMPGLYAAGEYDLAGFAVGEVDEDKLIDGRNIAVGDTLIALASSGIHSNGYSLVRKLVKEDETALLQQCLTPTTIYWPVVKNILPLVSGMAHITGGGLGNIPRMNMGFDYHLDALPSMDVIPSVFGEMAKRSGLEGRELYETFNMGIGFVMATKTPDALIAQLQQMGATYYKIGTVIKGNGMVQVDMPHMRFEC